MSPLAGGGGTPRVPPGPASPPPGAPPSTVVSLNDFKQRAGTLELDVFVARHAHPVLLIEKHERAGEDPGFQTLSVPPAGPSDDTHDPDDTATTSNSAGFRLADRLRQPAEGRSSIYVCILAKLNPNKFASIITVGRAANNDVRINIPSVSKFHAYFTHIARDDSWFVADANSSNGTWVNGERLKADRGRAKLSNGSSVRLGPDALGQFLDARGFYELLRALRD